MNCFEWQNHASDYLDGTLIGTRKREADDHLDLCPSCNERQKHYRIILSSLASQPRSRLPIPIRKSPFSASLPLSDAMHRRTWRSRWDSIHWLVRSILEGAFVLFLVVVGVTFAPRIRRLYETGMEHRLSAFSDPLPTEEPTDSERTDAKPGDASPPLLRGNLSDQPTLDEPSPHENTEDFASETEGDNAEAREQDDSAPVTPVKKHAAGEVWRFNLKTDSPRDLRSQVLQVLLGLHLVAGSRSEGGVEAPGGIQFDLLIPSESVQPVKEALEKIAHKRSPHLTSVAETRGPNGSEPFTWYKNKSKTKMPPGKARVVIWLSQM